MTTDNQCVEEIAVDDIQITTLKHDTDSNCDAHMEITLCPVYAISPWCIVRHLMGTLLTCSNRCSTHTSTPCQLPPKEHVQRVRSLSETRDIIDGISEPDKKTYKATKPRLLSAGRGLQCQTQPSATSWQEFGVTQRGQSL